MGLIDAIKEDARVELKVGDLYDILRAAADNHATAQYLLNAVKCEVPYNYIREIMTGKKEEAKAGVFCIEIPRDILDAAFEEAKKAVREATAAAGLEEDIAGMAEESEQQGDHALPFNTEESEGGEE